MGLESPNKISNSPKVVALKTTLCDDVGDFSCFCAGTGRGGVARPFSVLGEYLSEEVYKGRDQQGVTDETPGTGIGGGPLHGDGLQDRGGLGGGDLL